MNRRLDWRKFNAQELAQVFGLDEDQEVVRAEWNDETKELMVFVEEDEYTCRHVKNYILHEIAEKHHPWICTLCDEQGVDEEMEVIDLTDDEDDAVYESEVLEIYIPEGATFEEVTAMLEEQGFQVIDLSHLSDEELEDYLKEHGIEMIDVYEEDDEDE